MQKKLDIYMIDDGGNLRSRFIILGLNYTLRLWENIQILKSTIL